MLSGRSQIGNLRVKQQNRSMLKATIIIKYMKRISPISPRPYVSNHSEQSIQTTGQDERHNVRSNEHGSRSDKLEFASNDWHHWQEPIDTTDGQTKSFSRQFVFFSDFDQPVNEDAAHCVRYVTLLPHIIQLRSKLNLKRSSTCYRKIYFPKLLTQ